MTLRLATINLDVADPQRSKRFYVDALGMSENLERSEAPNFVYLESPGAAITLATPEAATAAEPSRTMELGFEAGDLAAVETALKEAGATGFQSQSMGWGDVLEGRDFDGHRVIVYCFRRA